MLMMGMFILLGIAAGVRADTRTEPTVDRTSIIIRAISGYTEWTSNTVWKWYPTIEFRVNGPITAGGQLYIEYTKEGKPWISYDCETGETAADGWYTTSGGMNGSDTLQEKMANYEGYVDFSIKLKNALEGTDKELFNGKFKVKKTAGANPEEKQFYVDYDWEIPIALIMYPTWFTGYNGWERVDEGLLQCWMWFLGDSTIRNEPVAYLYYNGKKVSSSSDDDHGVAKDQITVQTSALTGRSYMCYAFQFGLVYGIRTRPESEDFSETWRLNAHPGDYEIKVLWNGNLVRTAVFSVDADGKLVDNGINEQSKLETPLFQLSNATTISDNVVVLPVKILGNDGLTYDENAWKTDAYWGHPLVGFTLP
jgi:hypothetical protein